MTGVPPEEPDGAAPGRLFVVSGLQAAGKTTVGMALARTLTRSVFIDGPMIGDLVISGKEPMSRPPSQGAVEQLLYRFVGALVVADTYRTAGFDAVIADDVHGEYVEDFLELAAPETVHLVTLHPSKDTLRLREMERGQGWFDTGEEVDAQWDALELAPARLGLWVDNSHQSVAETVLEILQRQDEAVIATS